MPQGLLPELPLTGNMFLLFGALLLAGVVGGALVRRFTPLPAVTGYIAGGILVGPSGLNALELWIVQDVRALLDVAISLILFELGRRLDFNWLRHDRGLLLTGAWETALSFVLMFGALLLVGIEPLYAALAAAVGISTSPAVVLLVVRELRSEGQVTKRALSLVAINNIVALALLTTFLPFVHFEFKAPWAIALLHPLYVLAGSVALAFLTHAGLIMVARVVGKERGVQLALQLGAVLFVLGVSRTLQLSYLIAILVLGVLTKNLDRRHDLVDVEWGYFGQAFFILLFVITGASVQWQQFGQVGSAVLAFLAARFLGKSLGVFVFARMSGLSLKQALALSLMLVPMAGLAVGLGYSLTDIYPDLGRRLTAIIGVAAATLYLIGPIAVQFALKWTRETHPER